MYRKNKKNLTGLAFVSPWVIGFLVFTLGPCFYTLVVSFMKWDLMTEPEFVGLQNYINLLDDDLFKQSLLVTFRFAVICRIGNRGSDRLVLDFQQRLRRAQLFSFLVGIRRPQLAGQPSICAVGLCYHYGDNLYRRSDDYLCGRPAKYTCLSL